MRYWRAWLAFALLVSRPAPSPLAVDQLLSFSFPDNLIVATSGATIAWTFNERGVRNIYAARAPDFVARRLTPYGSNDGQELTHLSISDDGNTIVYGHAFQFPAHAGASGAIEYLDVIAAGKYLQARGDVDARRIGIWGGSYGGYLTGLALGRNSDVFAAGVDIHGVNNWNRVGRPAPDLWSALAGDGITEADLQEAARVVYASSPVSAVATWTSPVLLVHADDDRNVEFHQTVDLQQRLVAKGVKVDELVIPDDIHAFLLWRTWKTVIGATADYFDRIFLKGA